MTNDNIFSGHDSYDYTIVMLSKAGEWGWHIARLGFFLE